MKGKRLFVGNLPHAVDEDDIEKKFSKYGKVVSVEKKQRFGPENEVTSTFAFVTLEVNKKTLDECIKTVSVTPWNGHILKLELAKESFLSKLKREREEISSNKLVNGETSPKKKKDDRPDIKISYNNQSESSNENDYSSDTSVKDRGLKMFEGTKSNSFQERKPITKPKLNNYKEKQVMKTFEDFSDVWRDDYEYQNVENTASFDELNESDDSSYKQKKEASFSSYNVIKMEDVNNKIEIETHRNKWFPKSTKIKTEKSESVNTEMNASEGDFKLSHVKVENNSESSKTRNSICSPVMNSTQVDNTNFNSDIKNKLAEEKRVKAFEEKRQLLSKQKNVVKMALAGIDKKEKPNKKIIFDEAEENGFENKIELRTNEEQQKKSLFDDDSGDEGTGFNINQQFEGSKGQKLLALQSRYAHDDRFAMDSRFIDSDEESVIEKMPESKSEKEKQLEILEQVVGVQVRKPENTKKNSLKQMSTNTMLLRFDPTRSEHSQFIVQPTKSENKADVEKKKRKKPEKDIENEETTVTKVTKETFYNVEDKLKDSLKSNESSGFSLRKLFGSNEADESDSGRADDFSHKPASLPIKRMRQSNPFKYDSSDTESEEEEKEDKSRYLSKPTLQPTLFQPFFFQANDPRFEELKDFFGRQEVVDEEEFSRKRKELKRILHHRQMNKKQKNRPFQKNIGGGRKKIVKKPFNASNKWKHKNRTKPNNYK